MSERKEQRLRRAGRIRRKIADLGVDRLCIFRTPRHIYAQIFDATGARVLVSASTVEGELRAALKNGGNSDAARAVGLRIAEKAKAAGIARVAFDRAGFRFHGRIRALADAAREGGLQF